MIGTSLSTIILFSIPIALISFFSRAWILMIFILIFVYLLPRAGFLLHTTWYRFPLPIGYILIAFIMIRWAFYLILKRDEEKKINPIRKVFPLYIVIAILAIIIGFLNSGHIPTMLLEVLFYFAAFFVFFITIDIFQRKDCAKIFMAGMLLCGLLVPVYGILLLVYGKALLINYITYNAATYMALEGQFIGAKRTLSTYGDPNVLNAQLMVFCGVFTSLLLQGKYSLLKRIFLLIGLVLIVACIYFASSRASLIGLFVMLIVFAMTRIKKLWLYIPILVMGYFFFIEPVRKYYEHRIFTAGITSDLRITYFKIFFDLLLRFPFGVGFGNSIDENYNMVTARSIWQGFNSFYLHFLSRVGIQGLATFAIMFFLILRYVFREIYKVEDPNIKYFVFGAAWGIIVQQFNFITNNIYQVPGGMLNFWVMCGMLVVIINLYKSRSGQ